MNSNPANSETTAAAATNGDPLIDEVRAIRKELGDRFGNDVVKLADYVRQVGEEYHRRNAPGTQTLPTTSG